MAMSILLKENHFQNLFKKYCSTFLLTNYFLVISNIFLIIFTYTVKLMLLPIHMHLIV